MPIMSQPIQTVLSNSARSRRETVRRARQDSRRKGAVRRTQSGPAGPHHASSLSKAAAGELVLIDRATAEQVRNRAQGRADQRFEEVVNPPSCRWGAPRATAA